MLPLKIFGTAVHAAERGVLPDSVVRLGIRRLMARRSRELDARSCAGRAEWTRRFLAECAESPIAALPEAANEQHYEVPAAFFSEVLGPHRKYSCCHWGAGVGSLEAAEEAALAATCARAGIRDGDRILELGCGWGSLSLWMAQRCPNARVTAVSNSGSQKAFIEDRAAERGVANLEVVTADVNGFDPGRRFDRIVSVEMFEHVRNHAALLRRVAGWLEPEGRLFVHVFCHRHTPYFYEARHDGDWMSRHFFSGGMMPSDDLLPRCQKDLVLRDQWRWNGRHYARTCNAWLARLDAHRDRVWPILEEVYGKSQAGTWFHRWRMFFMACAELFAFRGGEEWWVSHYAFERRDR